jgi:hypothetical protein
MVRTGKPLPQSKEPKPLGKPLRLRELDELLPLAKLIGENAELMGRLRAAAGAENKELARNVIDEITRYAQTLDPSVTTVDGNSLTIILMKMIRHTGARSDD